MAEAIVSKVARLLDDLAKDGKLGDVDGYISGLKVIVPTLQKVVHEAEKTTIESGGIEAWLEDVKEAFYDAEDLLEEWNLEVAQPRESTSEDEKSKQVSASYSPSKQLARGLKVIGERIEEIDARGRNLDLQEYPKDLQVKSGSRKRLRPDTFVVGRDGAESAITDDGAFNFDLQEHEKDVQVESGSRKREQSDPFVYGEEIIGREDAKSAITDGAESAITDDGAFNFELQEHEKDVQVESGSRKREQSDPFVYGEEIIGREDAKSAIMKFLLDSSHTEEKVSSFSIVGTSGIGKTALARCLYEDDLVKNHFDLRIWVCVGEHSSNLKIILQKIIESATTERADDFELEGLQNQLEEYICGKKYLLVLDSVRSEFHEQWASLEILLMGGAEGSKILMTTCEWLVGDSTSITRSYNLEALSERLSLELLMRMACQEEKETRKLKKLTIGKQIVKFCCGIPLFIRKIGSILFFKKAEAEWIHLEHEILKISEYYSVNAYLKFSYQHLPSHLKQCFAFCSLFPKDWVIDKQMLMSLWMAEGFIWPIDNVDRDTEDIAHDYFMDLLRRNFFQNCTKDEVGNVTSCKMHDLMNELACMVAKPEYSRGFDWSLSSIGTRSRHVSWDSTLDSSWGLPTALFGEHLRTFIKMDQAKSSRCQALMDEKTLCEVISSSKYLRVLDCHDSGIEKLPSSICELKHLTFLDLSENEGIIMLPDSMTRLQKLQVLKLNMCYKLIELPRDIRKLVNLRQLEISNCNALSHMPHGLGQLTLLHTLTDFLLPGDDSCPENCSGLGELKRLSNLRGSLRIEFKGEIEDVVAQANAANLKEKDFLVSLVLVFAGKESDEVLLEELQPSLNLRSLEIRGYGSTRFPSWISRMPKLVELRLYHCAACRSLPPLGELTSLMRLEIVVLPIVKCTKSDLHALSSLPNISALRIRECPNLTWIPPLLDLKESELSSFPLELSQTSVATIEQVIGIDDRAKEVIKLLKINDDGGKPHMVGLHGTNGIGKTTIAKAVYNQLSSCFDSCSFLAEIGETAQDGGIQFVQTKLIRDILERDGDVASFEGGIKFFLDVFSNINALIVLDDVEEQSHLDDLVGNQLEWFGPGSRIIVTSENRGILETCVSRGWADIYEVNKMHNDRALELFRKHASIPWYPEIGKRIVKATGQVPFFIEVIGSLLHGKTIEDWKKMEDLIKPHSREILKDCGEILNICYEALDEKQKQIFWDIAWFANGVDSQIASYMWPDVDLFPSYQVLMPLAKIGEDNMLWMHKLLKRFCRTIDQEEPKYPVKRRRLYMHDPDLKVINKEEGMEVEALCIDSRNHGHPTFTEKDFVRVPNVRFLKLDNASITGNFTNVFPKLRWLHWQGCPKDFKGTEFNLTELVILDLSWSKVTEDWRGWRESKMKQLKVLNLTGCTDLLISPEFSSFPNLEILILERCSRLVHLDPSVEGLEKLLCLNLKSCTELNRLPAKLGASKALKELLIDETSVREISLGSDLKKVEHLPSLSILSADNSKITELPNGVGVKLRHLSLRNCHWIRKLPESIGQVGSPLEELDISGTGISELANSFVNLQRLSVLKMDHCFISKFPSFIWLLQSLEEIHASSCRNLKGKIPGNIRQLINLRILRLRNSAISSLPPEIEHLSKLKILDVLHCNKLFELPALPSSLVIVHLSPKLKEKVSNLWDKHCFIVSGMDEGAGSSGGHADAGSSQYKGVRLQKWGEWVSEIQLPNSQERIWLGLYDSPEKAARAFDAALYCLQGWHAQFNFPDSPPNIAGARGLTPSEIQVVAAQFANQGPESLGQGRRNDDGHGHGHGHGHGVLPSVAREGGDKGNGNDGGNGHADASDSKYKGVRLRKQGKWVSEIRLPNSRERIWLGSYDSPEKAARAFDAAQFCLRGRNARFNFPDSPPDIAGGRCLTPSEIQVVAAQFANQAPESSGQGRKNDAGHGHGHRHGASPSAAQEGSDNRSGGHGHGHGHGASPLAAGKGSDVGSGSEGRSRGMDLLLLDGFVRQRLP